MRFAISNIAWSAEEDRRVLRALPEHGCQALEIAPTRILPETPYKRLPEAAAFAKELLRETGMPICSMQSIWYRRSERIFGSPEETAALIDYTKEAILFAEAVGCPNLVFGSPKNRIIPEGKTRGDAVDFFRTIGDFAAEHGAAIALEAVPVSYGTNFLNRTDEVYEFVRTVGSEGLRMNLDFGTMLTNGEDVSDIARYIPWVNHVHISEDGLAGIERREEHRAFLRALKDGGYARCVSIEMRNQEDPDKVLAIVDYVYGLMKELCGL